MKKILALSLVLVLALSFAGCTKKENLTLGGTLKEEFLEISKDEKNPLAIAEKLMENELIEFAPMTMEIEEGYLAGFDVEEINGFEEGAVFSPMIGTIPFVGYIFSLESEDDADEFIAMLEEHANLNWNVCTSADEVNTAKNDNLVFFLMSPLTLEQEPIEE